MNKTISQAKKKLGETRIRGWVYRERGSNIRRFIIIRDGTGILQCVVEKEKIPNWSEVEETTIESAVEIEGEVVKDERAPEGYELRAKAFKLLSKAEPFPITKDFSTEFLLDVRHLWIRSRALTTAFRIRAKILEACREFFKAKNYIEVSPPIITKTSCEGGATQFELNYFGEPAYLSQSAQLYLEALIYSLEKVYSLTPSFRAEPSKTTRHLSEFWHLEAEAAWLDFEGLINLVEELVSYICQSVAKNCQEDLLFFKRDPKDLLLVKPPFPRMTYAEALKEIAKKGKKISWGTDLRTIEEDLLTRDLKKPLIVTHYPKEIKAFYMKEDPKDPKVVLCFDLLAPQGYGELVGASERETDLEKLKQRLMAAGEKIENYSWYLDLRRYGSVSHSGFGLGVERFLRWICRLPTIREAIPFPRTIKRVSP